MPPKPKSPAKGKKGKLSKAEKERLKKEELERKEKEEEDARLKAEQEEKDRLERERLEREERERIEAAESQRYTAESQDLLSLLEGNRNALVTLLEDRKQKAQWLRFMKCDGSPDPTVNAEINTYINLWKEDESRNDLDAVLKESNQTLDLINELQQYLEAADNIDLTDGEVLRYEETIVELEDLLHAKQDAATFELLKVTLASRLLTFSLLKEMEILTSLVRLTSPFVSTVVRGPWALGTLHKPTHSSFLLYSSTRYMLVLAYGHCPVVVGNQCSCAGT